MKLAIHPVVFLLGCVLLCVTWLALRPTPQLPAPPAPRERPAPARVRIERRTVEVSPATLQRYEGIYWVDASLSIAIKREGARLFSEATRQPRFELLPTKENEFYVKELDVNVVFDVGADGTATGLAVRFATGEYSAQRVR